MGNPEAEREVSFASLYLTLETELCQYVQINQLQITEESDMAGAICAF